jgi:hypothetical protein
MLSAVAIATKGYPGKGFFVLASQLGKYDGSTAKQQRDFWNRECQEVYRTWAPQRGAADL